jgi:hypothetical protein
MTIRSTTRRDRRTIEPSITDILQLGAAFFSFIGALYNIYFGNTGNGIAFMVAALGFAANATKYNYYIVLTKIFNRGTKLARIFLLLIAIGGSLLSIDLYANVGLIPPYVDTIIKRLGPALVLITILLIVTNTLSSSVTHISAIKKDRIIISYEPVLYISAFFLIISVLLLFLGMNNMDMLGSCKGISGEELDQCKKIKEKYKIPGWDILNDNISHFQIMIIAILSIWYVYSYICVILRLVEYYLKEKVSL